MRGAIYELYLTKPVEDKSLNFLLVGATVSPEAREKMYAQQRKRYAEDPEYKKYVLEKNKRNYALQKQRMAEDPEYAAFVRANYRDATRRRRARLKEQQIQNTAPSVER